MNRPGSISFEMAGAGAGVEEVAVEDRVALPLLILDYMVSIGNYICHTLRNRTWSEYIVFTDT